MNSKMTTLLTWNNVFLMEVWSKTLTIFFCISLKEFLLKGGFQNILQRCKADPAISGLNYVHPSRLE